MNCYICGSGRITIYKQINESGAIVVVAKCENEHNPYKGMPFLPKKDYDINILPLLKDLRTIPCEVCGSNEGVELHHYAPKSLFENYNDWATQYLCQKCHDLWHYTTRTGKWSKTK